MVFDWSIPNITKINCSVDSKYIVRVLDMVQENTDPYTECELEGKFSLYVTKFLLGWSKA